MDDQHSSRNAEAECPHAHGFALAAVAVWATLLAGCASTAQPAPTASLSSAAARGVAASDAATQSLLSTACYDCHSDRASVPWYGALAPSYWFSGKAQKALNFSAWASYDARQRADELAAIVKTVDSEEMPPRDYTLLVASARLTSEQRQAIAAWAKSGGH